MPGERQLGARREDPDPHVAAALGREHEHRLGDVQLSGDALHLLVENGCPSVNTPSWFPSSGVSVKTSRT